MELQSQRASGFHVRDPGFTKPHLSAGWTSGEPRQVTFSQPRWPRHPRRPARVEMVLLVRGSSARMILEEQRRRWT